MQVKYTEKEFRKKKTGKEIWRWIPGYKGWYKVSDHGRVKSVDRSIRAWNGAVWCVINYKSRYLIPYKVPLRVFAKKFGVGEGTVLGVYRNESWVKL